MTSLIKKRKRQRAIFAVENEWMSDLRGGVEIRKANRDDELFLLGDFNQDLASFHYFGSKKNRLALENALLESG